MRGDGKGTYTDPFQIGSIFRSRKAVGISMPHMNMGVINGALHNKESGLFIIILKERLQYPYIYFVKKYGFAQRRTFIQKGTTLYIVELDELIEAGMENIAHLHKKDKQSKLL